MRCAVAKCKQSKQSTSGNTVHFYSFPKDEAQRKLWVMFCNRVNTINAENERICSLHFKQEDFVRNLKFEMGFTDRSAPKLKSRVIPTVCSSSAIANVVKPHSCNEEITPPMVIDTIKKEADTFTCDEKHLPMKTDEIKIEIETCTCDAKNIPTTTADINEDSGLQLHIKTLETKICKDNDIFDGDTSQSTDDFEMPWTSKISTKKRKTQKNRPSRKIGLTWSKQNETSLILAVQKQRALWDCSVPEYKLTHAKLSYWQEVAQELDMPVENWSEARKKWNSMRSNFKAFVGKHRSKKSGQRVNELNNVKYPHFNEMLFIESVAEAEKSYQSTGNNTTDETILDNSQSQAVYEEMSPIIIPPTVGQRRNLSASITPIPTSSPTLSSSGVNKNAPEVLANFQNQQAPADRFTAIGEVFAGHLRNLNASDAIILESRLFKVLYDFLGSRTSACASSNVTILD